ncbi:unnamed protein product [Echinostoma caproni]|uniref:RNA-binding motif protein, X-linked 2 n=1 Tax=Echinostoma caproni TaxID=27848 RepID=A0A183AVB2_9TREM|nr:unnamed protein product [Echinostoma caproni]
MNPLTNTKNQNILNERELRLGYTGTLSSWHRQYKDSAWIFIGGLNYELTEGDLICVFSQYGEIVNINLVRDRKTGQSKGFGFLCYEDQRSTVLATDNLNGIKLAGRVIRVDHVEQYKVPKDGTLDVGVNAGRKSSKRATVPDDPDAVASFVREHGCGPEVMKQLQKLQEEQAKLANEKAKRRADRHTTDKSSGHSRLPIRRDWCPSPPRQIQDSSPSPPRRKGNSTPSPPRRRHDLISPPRRRRDTTRSPPRRRHGSTPTPPRQRHNSVSSPQRRDDFSPSPPRQRQNPTAAMREERNTSRSFSDRNGKSIPHMKQESPFNPRTDRSFPHARSDRR